MKTFRYGPLLVGISIFLAGCALNSPLSSSQRAEEKARMHLIKKFYNHLQDEISHEQASGSLVILPPHKSELYSQKSLDTWVGHSPIDAAIRRSASRGNAGALPDSFICIWVPAAVTSVRPEEIPCSQLEYDVERILDARKAIGTLEHKEAQLSDQLASLSMHTKALELAIKDQESSLSKLATGLTTALAFSVANDKRLDLVTDQVNIATKAFNDSAAHLQSLINDTSSLAASVKSNQDSVNAQLKQIMDTVQAIH